MLSAPVLSPRPTGMTRKREAEKTEGSFEEHDKKGTNKRGKAKQRLNNGVAQAGGGLHAFGDAFALM